MSSPQGRSSLFSWEVQVNFLVLIYFVWTGRLLLRGFSPLFSTVAYEVLLFLFSLVLSRVSSVLLLFGGVRLFRGSLSQLMYHVIRSSFVGYGVLPCFSVHSGSPGCGGYPVHLVPLSGVGGTLHCCDPTSVVFSQRVSFYVCSFS